jgi:hypothetical protein
MSMSASGASSNYGSAAFNKFSSSAVPTGSNYNVNADINMKADTSNWGKMNMQESAFYNGDYAQNLNEIVNQAKQQSVAKKAYVS